MSHKETGVPYEVVAFIFAGEKTALALNDDLKAGGHYEACSVIARVVVEVDDEGRARMPRLSRRVQDVGLGVLAGGLLGMIGGPEGLLAWVVIGAIVGSQVERLRSRPIPMEDLQRLATQMQPDSSAIVTLVTLVQAEALIAAMAPHKAQVVTLRVDDRVSREIGQALPGSGEEYHES
jgi:uncharacterized membrane protein